MKKPGDFIHMPSAGTTPIYIQYKGLFDMEDVYQSIADFFKQKKFRFYEKQQRHRRPGPFGPEVLYQFEAQRDVEDYYKWYVYITIETFDMQEVEVIQKDGKKKKMTKGKFWAQLHGVVETDYAKYWEKSAFLAHLKSFYNKYVVRKRYEGIWWDEMHYNIVIRLHALIKERLKMTSEVYEHRYYSRIH
jgi:hypothetical protein